MFSVDTRTLLYTVLVARIADILTCELAMGSQYPETNSKQTLH